jgi:hypothetical protein
LRRRKVSCHECAALADICLAPADAFLSGG